MLCLQCGDEFTPSTAGDGAPASSSGPYDHFAVGLVLQVEAIPKKDLKKVLVDITGDSDESKAIQIVTNAKHIEAGWKVVVALEGAVIPAGAVFGEDPSAIQVKRASVGGTSSSGMLCDSEMLNWSGGAKGVVQRLPDSFTIGERPPPTRPRT